MEKKWTDDIKNRLSELYTDTQTRPGHTPKGINTQKTAKISPQLNDQAKDGQAWGSDTPTE